MDDNSLMPFGKEHKGKALSNVPANYLLWWLDNGSKESHERFHELRDYIIENKKDLEREAKNG